MSSRVIKEVAKRLIGGLPDYAAWNDLIHEINIRQSIEKGFSVSEAGRTVEVREIRARHTQTE